MLMFNDWKNYNSIIEKKMKELCRNLNVVVWKDIGRLREGIALKVVVYPGKRVVRCRRRIDEWCKYFSHKKEVTGIKENVNKYVNVFGCSLSNTYIDEM